ncbi:MAG: pyridoxamine 5'-phosphate oxidase family protein [Roseiflexaceae bacterium]|nr:pyridoxamine 5'-phosphate oxidase family protein [Roseiflexaceae bacterium]
MQRPIVDRPVLPADYGVPESLEQLLPWSHVTERLERAMIYWVGTVRPNGRPHSSPIWGVWLDETLFFDGSPETRRGKNMSANPAVSIHIESGGAGKDVVVLEGDALQVRGSTLDPAFKRRLADQYAAKYLADCYQPEPDQWDAGGLYRLQLHTVIAWTTFNIDPTRWRFQGRASA